MKQKWVMHDFISGQDIELPDLDQTSPTEAWVRGWNEGMIYGLSCSNPYSPTSQEAVDWDEGRDAAVCD